MALLDQEQYNMIIEKGKEAVTAIKNQDLEIFLQKVDEGWEQFPEPKNSWIRGTIIPK